MTTRRTTSLAPRASDVLLGLLLMVAGLLLLAGTVLKVIPSVAAFSALTGAAGLVCIVGALVGRTSPGFFSEVVSGAALAVLAFVGLRYADAELATLALIAGCMFAVVGLVRIASATEFPWLRGPLLACGAASLGLAGAVFAGALTPTLALLAIVVGIQLIVDGVCALAIGRARLPR